MRARTLNVLRADLFMTPAVIDCLISLPRSEFDAIICHYRSIANFWRCVLHKFSFYLLTYLLIYVLNSYTFV